MTYFGKYHLTQDENFYVGDAIVHKSKVNLPIQGPVQPEEVEKHQTLMPHSHSRKNGIDTVAQKQPQVGAGSHSPGLRKDYDQPVLSDGQHRHQGHPETHPVKLRHRKTSADPLHKEEDGLMDEWRDLYDKATKGECTALEMQRLQEIRGRVDELNSTRAKDAENILGIAMKSLDRSMRKAEIDQPARAVAESPDDDEIKLEEKDESWRNRSAEYGDIEDDLDILPNNNGYKDEVDRSESVWGTPPKSDRVNVAYPDEVKDAPVSTKKGPEPALDTSMSVGKKVARSETGKIVIPKEMSKGSSTNKAELRKAIQVTKSVETMLTRDWGHFEKDDGRFSDPFFIAKFIAEGNQFPNIRKSLESSTTLVKHDLPGSPHWEHMTNGGGWGVKLNPKTHNYVAYQREDGDQTKREAQGEAVQRNKRNKAERDSNDKVDAALNPMFARKQQAHVG